MELIKIERDRRRYTGGVKVGDYWFKSDQAAVGEYAVLALLGTGLPGTTVLRAGWRTMKPGVTVDMTPNLVKQILLAGLSAVAAIDDWSQVLKAEVIAAEDPQTVDITAGWPAVYVPA